MADYRLACSAPRRMMGVGNNGLMLLLSEDRMITMGDRHRAAIRQAFDALPEEIRAEIVDGDIIVSPLQLNAHQRVIMYLNSLLAPVANTFDWWVDTSGGVILEPDWNEFRPDLQVMPAGAWPREGNSGPTVSEVKLVVEVTSPDRRDLNRDRVTKYTAYARAGIPLYLLVDRYDEEGFTTLYSNPSGSQYLDAHKVPFGEKLTLPAPFEVEVDTARF
jgi:Uma2 family endonuclease